MKRILLLFFIILTNNIIAQWKPYDVIVHNSNAVQQSKSLKLSANTLLSVSFYDSLNGWIAGENILLNTSDGGSTWSRNELSSDGSYFISIEASSVTSAWLLWRKTGQSYISRTTNSGLNWETLLRGGEGTISALSYNGIDALDSSRAWVFGRVSYLCQCAAPIARTSDGGNSWNSTGLEAFGWPCVSFNSISVFSDSIAMVLFCSKRLYRTSDSGITWLVDTLSGSYNQVAIADKKHSWIVGDQGMILHSADGGDSWVQQISNNTIDLLSIHPVDSLNVWAVGNSGIVLNTSDGGILWNLITVPTKLNLNDVFFLNNNLGWIVGDSGIVICIRNDSLTSVQNKSSVPTSFKLLQNFPNPFNPSTKIKYSIPAQSFVTLKVYDLLGREVATLVNEEHTAGNYEAEFNGKDLPSGVYFYQLKANEYVETKKMVLLR